MPYSVYNNYWNFTPNAVCFYGSNHNGDPVFENRIGIQVHYTVNGVKNSSDIVYHEVFPISSVADASIINKPVANVRYYNLAGQEVTHPTGMVIQVTTFTDGSRTATKVIK